MPFRRQDRRWRSSAVRRPLARLFAVAGLTAALLAPGLAASASVLPTRSAAVLDAKPVSPQPTNTEPSPPWTGVSKIHVEDGKIQDWQAMLVAAGGASLVLFLAGKVRKK